MEPVDRGKEVDSANKLLEFLKGGDRNQGLIGVPFYIAFIHTASNPKILEINSRPGDPEIMNILPTMETDLVDLCYDMINGTLTQVRYLKKASVLTYAVPMTYGGYRNNYSGESKVQLDKAYNLSSESGGNLFIYPGSMEVRDGSNYVLKSRAVAVLGVGGSINEARDRCLEGVKSIDGPLWNRWEIGSSRHIANSVNHLNSLRKG
jgi:phosphoribosylamine--glycine ligase